MTNTTERMLAASPCGKFTLLEYTKKSSTEWINVIVAANDDQWKFGWNGLRVSYCDDSENLRQNHRDIFVWAIETLKTMTAGEGSPNMWACRRDWLTRLRSRLEDNRASVIADLERQAAEIFEVEQQIMLLDAKVEASTPQAAPKDNVHRLH